MKKSYITPEVKVKAGLAEYFLTQTSMPVFPEQGGTEPEEDIDDPWKFN